MITCTTTEQIVAALRALRDEGTDPLVLAGGSNVVLADDLTDLTVVRLANTRITVDGNVMRAEAGAVWDDVVRAAIDAGLGGLECLSGIPGSAGATPVQNVGAYGAEVADTITRVRLLDRRTGEVRWVPRRRAAASATAPACSSTRRPDAAPCCRGGVRAATPTGRSAPLRYGELADARWAPSRASAPTRPRVREAVLALRARQGHGARRRRPRHLERRLVLHQPGGRRGRVRPAAGRGDGAGAELSGRRTG